MDMTQRFDFIILRILGAALLALAACDAPGRQHENGDDVDAGGPPSELDDPCDPRTLGRSYIGCEYYPTVTGNSVDNQFDFAVVIANATLEPATVMIDGGALTTVTTVTVAPASMKVVPLPWHEDLKLGTVDDPIFPPPAVLAAKGAYHLRSTQPVTVYQFSPLQYRLDGIGYSQSNDASLLLPVNVWGKSYFAAAWPNMNDFPGLLAVTAAEDHTTVTIKTKASTVAYGGAPAFPEGTPTQVVLDAGDVLEIGTVAGDLTGSAITSDKPVQVISGHFCTEVPLGTFACDHIEESIFPVETLSTRYLVTSPAVPSLPDGKGQYVRIVATAPNTSLVYDPPQPGAGVTLALPGDFVEMRKLGGGDFMVSADEKVMVVQYGESQEAGGDTGDPDMLLSVPVDQYRVTYLFHAPTNYEVNYVNVTAPTDATITLDGVAVSGFVPVGSSGYAVARVTLPNGVDGNHVISGTQAFGISVYGYGLYTSYWYPGGLQLEIIP